MVNIIAGIIILLCLVVLVFGLRVYKENRKMMPHKKTSEEEDDYPLRP